MRNRCKLFVNIILFAAFVYLSCYYLVFYRNSNNCDNLNRTFSLQHLPTLRKLNLIIDDDNDQIDRIDRIFLNSATSPVFVSAWSSQFQSRAIRLCASIMRYTAAVNDNNQRRLIVYNLGLTDAEMHSYRGDCPIAQFRAFNFSQYPTYVANLFEYRWKPLVIAEALVDFGAILWMDSSTVFRNNNSMQPIYDSITKQISSDHRLHFAQFASAGHSIYATTHRCMFAYFPQMSVDRSKSIEMYEASPMLWYATASTRRHLLTPLVRCALERQCMAPSGAQRYCRFSQDRFASFADCHRFDQSAINIIIAIASNFNTQRYRFDQSPLFTDRSSCASRSLCSTTHYIPIITTVCAFFVSIRFRQK